MLKPLHTSARRVSGLNTVIGDGGLGLLSLDLLVLGPGETFRLSTKGFEAAAVIMNGDVSATSAGRDYRLKRESVFTEPASTLFLPVETEAVFTAAAPTEIAICKAKSAQKGEAFFITPEMTKEKTVGRDNWERKVVDIIGTDAPASRLVVGETFNRPGGWSSFPPHKHDTVIPGAEVKMEEIYLFRLNPSEGFGTQSIYGKEGSYSFRVKDYDAVTIPWGYHPVSAMPGYGLYYLWFLAGVGRVLMPNTDPEYKWLEGK
jgi:5-deoxy-glucuronate isomerase